jgi:hypothetical protein
MEDLKKLLAAATPGLWKLFDGTTAPPWEVCTNKSGNCTIRQVGSSGYLSPWIASERDAALICAAVNALPEMLAENARLRQALQFYADPANHVGHSDPYASIYIETSAVDTDGGDIARAALKETGQ